MLLMTCCFGGVGNGESEQIFDILIVQARACFQHVRTNKQEQGVPAPAIFHTLVDKRIKPMQILTYYSDSCSPYSFDSLAFLHIIQHAGQQVLAVVAEMLAVNR